MADMMKPKTRTKAGDNSSINPTFGNIAQSANSGYMPPGSSLNDGFVIKTKSGDSKLSGDGYRSSGGSSRVGLGAGEKASKENISAARRDHPTSYNLKTGIDPNAMKQTRASDKATNTSKGKKK
jgi:hypothetical protein